MRARAVVALFGVVVASLAPATATAQAVDPPAPIDCPDVRPVDDVDAGDTGVGFTVSTGTTPDPFDVRVVDVLEDAIAPGLPLIVVEVDSPEIDRVGGIWAGMSGSPVYVGGELIGAIAYGFSFGPSKLGGVTPAAAMLDVAGRPSRPLPASVDDVTMSWTVQRHAADEHRIAAAQARTMSPLQVPVRLSGPAGDKLDRGVRAFGAAFPGTAVVGGGARTSTASTPIEVGAGDNLAVSLAYGDVGAIGTGTATTVCGGVVTGFGHPLTFAGATRMGLHGASAVRIVDDAVFGPYKLANAGAPVGTIDQDRLAAVAGRVGPLPATTAITSTVTTPDGRLVDGRSDVPFPDDLFSFVLFHGWTNLDLKALDDPFARGTSEVTWTVRGARADGRPFEVTRDDRHADLFDLSTASVIGAALAAQQLLDNPFEDVRITEVDLAIDVEDRYSPYQVLGDRITAVVDGEPRSLRDGVTVAPGTELQLRIPLRRYRAEERTVAVTLEVPEDAFGLVELIVSGGQNAGEDPFGCLFFPEDCADGAADDLDGLLAQLETAPRGDELVVELLLYDEVTGAERAVSSTVVALDDVVTGSAYHGLEVLDDDGGFEPPPAGGVCDGAAPAPFVDVDPAGTHAAAIGCAAGLDLVRGVSDSPPRFAPGRDVTRGQAAALLARTLDHLGVDLPSPPAGRFVDARGSVHAADIERLAAAGIVRGRSADRFAPQEPVTRGQLASLLTRSLAFATRTPVAPFGGPYHPDAVGTHAQAMAVVHERGLMLGRRDGTFRPEAHTRRDQFASVVVRLLEELGDGPGGGDDGDWDDGDGDWDGGDGEF